MVKNHVHGTIGHNKHGSTGQSSNEVPDAKRPRLHASGASSGGVDEAALVSLLQNEAVTCDSDLQAILSESEFALTIEPQGGACASSLICTTSHLVRDRGRLLTHLDLTSNDLEEADCKLLAEALAASSCNSLTTLSMKWMGIGPELSVAIAEAVRVNASITSLNMERNGLGIDGGKAFGAALCSNSSLTRLDISLNDIGPDGGRAVAEALLTRTTALTELSMLRCGQGPGGGKALGEALETNATLTSLDLTQNDLGVEGAIAFGAALRVNTTLRTLNMKFNRIGFGLERALVFAQSLEVNATLTWLDISQNELGAIGGLAFGKALKVRAEWGFGCSLIASARCPLPTVHRYTSSTVPDRSSPNCPLSPTAIAHSHPRHGRSTAASDSSISAVTSWGRGVGRPLETRSLPTPPSRMWTSATTKSAATARRRLQRH